MTRRQKREKTKRIKLMPKGWRVKFDGVTVRMNRARVGMKLVSLRMKYGGGTSP